MIIITISAEDNKYADQIEQMSDMAVVAEKPKSFSSETLQLIQIGAVIAVPMIAGVASVFVEMWKQKRGYSITIGKDEFSCTGFTKEETLKLAEQYAPNYISKEVPEEEMIRESVTAFLQKDQNNTEDADNE